MACPHRSCQHLLMQLRERAMSHDLCSSVIGQSMMNRAMPKSKGKMHTVFMDLSFGFMFSTFSMVKLMMSCRVKLIYGYACIAHL